MPVRTSGSRWYRFPQIRTVAPPGGLRGIGSCLEPSRSCETGVGYVHLVRCLFLDGIGTPSRRTLYPVGCLRQGEERRCEHRVLMLVLAVAIAVDV